MTQPVSLREAVERSANAVMTGNFMQLMSDITPEALAELMKMAPGAGQFAITAMPAITGYEIEEKGEADGGSLFHVTFTAAIGTATLAARWKEVLGQWKIVGASLVSFELAEGQAPPASPA